MQSILEPADNVTFVGPEEFWLFHSIYDETKQIHDAGFLTRQIVI